MPAVLLLLAACSKDDGSQTETLAADEPVAVSFTANVPAFATRSVIGSTDALHSPGFGVFAYYTEASNWETAGASATPNFMYNQQVTWSAGSWSYSPVKYWPNDNQPADDNGATGSQAHSYVSFFAYAPFGGSGIAVVGNNATPGAPSLTYTWDTGNDLLYALPVKDSYKYDDTNNTNDYGRVADVVPFTFHHALAMVEFKVRRKLSSGAAITLNSLTITSDGPVGGTFNLGSSAWTATTAGSAAPLSYSGSLPVTASTDASAHLVGSSLMMPASVTFTYNIGYTVGSIDYTPDAASMSPVTLDKGYKYTIVFVIDGDAIESYVLRDREAEQW